MSNLIPPLLSNSPPPILGPIDDEEDDEFGDFTSAVDLSYSCQGLSLPSSPTSSPTKIICEPTKNGSLDINRNNNSQIEDLKHCHTNDTHFIPVHKDYQDKRKKCDALTTLSKETEVNSTHLDISKLSVNNVNSEDLDVVSCKTENGKTNQHKNVTINSELETLPKLINNVPTTEGKSNCLYKENCSNEASEVDNEKSCRASIDSTTSTNGAQSIFQETADIVLNVPCFVSRENDVIRSKLGDCHDIPEHNSKLHKNHDKTEMSITYDSTYISGQDECSVKEKTVTNDAVRENSTVYLKEEPPDLSQEDNEFGDFENYDELDTKIPERTENLKTNVTVSNEADFSSNTLPCNEKSVETSNENLADVVTDDKYEIHNHEVLSGHFIEEPPELKLNEDTDEDNFNDFDYYPSETYAIDREDNEQELESVSKELPTDLHLRTTQLSLETKGNCDEEVIVSFKLETCESVQLDTESEEKISESSKAQCANDVSLSNPEDAADKSLKELLNNSTSRNIVEAEVRNASCVRKENEKLIINSNQDLCYTHTVSDDFGDYSGGFIGQLNVDFETKVSSNKDGESVQITENTSTEQNVTCADFAKFDTNEVDDRNVEETESDFGDFNNFQDSVSTANADNPVIGYRDQSGSVNDDDFGEFDNYIQHDAAADFANFETAEAEAVSFDYDALVLKAETIILEMFPVCEENCEEFSFDSDRVDFVFKQMKDVTDTNALTYQWPKSSSQDSLLTALNIDTRNILYGPGWNSSMPKFAANLSLAPLEPMKPEILTPMPASTINVSQSPHPVPPSSVEVEVPTAQFDWSGSGLTNPLDCAQASTILLDLEQLVASLDITNSTSVISQTPSPLGDFDEWEYWLNSLPKEIQGNPDLNQIDTVQVPQVSTSNLATPLPRLQSDNESVNSLHLTTDTAQETEERQTKPGTEPATADANDEFDDFTSYQTSKPADISNWSSPVPLRETYISNQHTLSVNKKNSLESDNGEPCWLKPTIVTPDLPRKVQRAEDNYDDDFTEFQVSLPSTSTNAAKETGIATDVALEDEFSEFHTSEVQMPTVSAAVTVCSTVAGVSLTGTSSHVNILQPMTILEPLKPKILQPQVSTDTSAQINWPDPGVTEDDIRNIELMYSNRHTTEPKLVPNIAPIPKSSTSSFKSSKENNTATVFENSNFTSRSTARNNNPSFVPSHRHLNSQSNGIKSEKFVSHANSSVINQSNVDDDEWSDFVCNPEPVKPNIEHHPSKVFSGFNRPERTSTPELQLSVPQLTQLQPPKLPIPVITPHGLLQTKIPSNTTNVNPSAQPSVLSNAFHAHDLFQPSIISNQYQSHVNGPTFNKPTLQSSSNVHFSHSNSFSNFTNGYAPHSSGNSSRSFSKPPSVFLKAALPVKSSPNDDDDWTDFISSPPIQTDRAQNGFSTPHLHPVASKGLDWNASPQFNNWSANITPNIITNPVHFDSFHSFVPQNNDVLSSKTSRKGTNILLQSKRTTIPSISALPDLDIVGKSRSKK